MGQQGHEARETMRAGPHLEDKPTTNDGLHCTKKLPESLLLTYALRPVDEGEF